ncbi:MAG: hypothetical protein HOA15_05285 [Candidatus Marinimicrobia bacterium]|nr:hypothetical protein [Candidatus Neomarinimicrobiota bacterium]MBT3676464.1 hypothetical protein [Candidatus Neomarinimicrobiota bacterium]MBT3762867.1 hypothetical protein [Candidatus Neomarinimicrobiota bacterium]MBT4067867.1 hypothetical protein [Candidatus Neomarinimicrobiota bacterium]MBT4269869.1 hypothetical protein [Candidatus Neomarinimicrobiota bacterium]
MSCALSKSPEPEVFIIPKKNITEKSSQNNEEAKKTSSKPSPRQRSTRSSFQVQTLPEGWTVDRHLVAKWGMSMPTVMSNVIDSAQTVEYWEEVIDLPTGYKLPLKRSKVLFQIITRLTIETVELHFINVDYIYSSNNHEPSHFILNGVLRTIELKPTGFPQLIADDVIKYKFLMEYGTPREFADGFHKYENNQTVLKVRELDKSHVQIQMNSTVVDQKLRTAIDDMYSEEGIEYQKKLLLRSIDI